jgi:ABC-type amino acid transport substrate-binding protein
VGAGTRFLAAGENLAAVKSAGVLKIGTEGTYAPFTYHDLGKLVGFDVEIGKPLPQSSASRRSSSKASGTA